MWSSYNMVWWSSHRLILHMQTMDIQEYLIHVYQSTYKHHLSHKFCLIRPLASDCGIIDNMVLPWLLCEYNIQDTKQKCFIVTIFLHLSLFYVHYCNFNTITKSKNFQTSSLQDLIYKSALHYSIIQVISQASLAQAYFIVELLWCH